MMMTNLRPGYSSSWLAGRKPGRTGGGYLFIDA